jgi:hypothetical protein
MKKITDFINRYQFKKSYEYEVKSYFADLVEKKFDLKFDLNKIKVKNNIIYLDLDSKIKALIILNKQIILTDLNNIITGPKIININ